MNLPDLKGGPKLYPPPLSVFHVQIFSELPDETNHDCIFTSQLETENDYRNVLSCHSGGIYFILSFARGRVHLAWLTTLNIETLFTRQRCILSRSGKHGWNRTVTI